MGDFEKVTLTKDLKETCISGGRAFQAEGTIRPKAAINSWRSTTANSGTNKQGL